VLLHTLDRALDGVGQGRRGELAGPLHKAAEAYHRRSILVLISDLYEEPRTVLKAVARLSHGGSDLIVFHLLDPAELRFPFDQPASYEDLESGERIPVVPEEVRARYRELVDEHVKGLARLLGENRIDYALFDTSRPLDHALFEYLSRRERLVRLR
jgi:hypothetical protein